jgi:probable F420-dependent oxidoreductase
MPAPRISVGLPQYVPEESAPVVARYAALAEELGFAGLWTVDAVPGAGTSRAPALDGLHLLTAAGAVTREIGLGVSVIVLPARNPARLAGELATIDQLSSGRLTVGVGIGRDDPVAESLGLSADRRVLRFREGLAIMRAVWAGDDVSFGGDLYRFSDVSIEPKPVQRPGPPVWFGAGTPPALRRAARLGDGWMGAGPSSSAAFADQVRTLEDALGEEDRDPDSFPIAKRVFVAVEATEARARDRLAARLDGFYGAPGLTERVAICGPPAACAEALAGLVQAGAHELVLNPLYDHLRQLEALTEVTALVRAV